MSCNCLENKVNTDGKKVKQLKKSGKILCTGDGSTRGFDDASNSTTYHISYDFYAEF